MREPPPGDRGDAIPLGHAQPGGGGDGGGTGRGGRGARACSAAEYEREGGQAARDERAERLDSVHGEGWRRPKSAPLDGNAPAPRAYPADSLARLSPRRMSP